MSSTISDSTNKFVELNHEWKGTNSFEYGVSTVRTMSDPNDSSKNAASTEWVNLYFNAKTSPAPTINTPLLTPMWFDHKISSPAWVCSDYERSEDYGWINGSVYDKIFTHLKLDVGDGVASPHNVTVYDEKYATNKTFSVSYFLAADGHKIIISEQDHNTDDDIFDACGVSWFYVLDINNKRFKLPRNRYGFQGIKKGRSVSDIDTPELPSIKLDSEFKNPSLKYSYTKPSVSTSIGGTIKITGYTKPDGAHAHNNGTKIPTYSCSQYGFGQGFLGRPVMNVSYSNSKTPSTGSEHSHEIDLTASASELYATTTTNGGDLSISLEPGSSNVSLIKNQHIYGKSDTVRMAATEMYLYFSTGDENAGSGLGYGGGVIDGDRLESESTSAVTIGNTYSSIYTVGNDCLLFISVKTPQIGQSSNETIIFKLNDSIISSENVQFSSVQMEYGIRIPAHRGSTISAVSTSPNPSAYFYEYKLLSMDPQIAMPDYGSTSESVTSGWQASENGWLFMRESVSSAEIKIDDKTISIPASSESGIGSVIIPISKGEILNFSGMTDDSKFYPCKTVIQSNPPVYITRTAYGNVAENKISSKTYYVGDYVKDGNGYYYCSASGDGGTADWKPVPQSEVPTWWYRLYSDGWCEQGGEMFIPEEHKDSLSWGIITMKIPMRDSHYNIQSTVHDKIDFGQTRLYGTSRLTVASDTNEKFRYNEGDSSGTSCGSSPFSWEVRGYFD